MDVPLLGERVLELLAQLAHVDVDGAVVAAEGPLPHRRVQLGPADEPAGTARKRGEEGQLAWRQGEWLPLGERAELAGADLQLSGADGLSDRSSLHRHGWCRHPPKIRLLGRDRRVNNL